MTQKEIAEMDHIDRYICSDDMSVEWILGVHWDDTEANHARVRRWVNSRINSDIWDIGDKMKLKKVWMRECIIDGEECWQQAKYKKGVTIKATRIEVIE